MSAAASDLEHRPHTCTVVAWADYRDSLPSSIENIYLGAYGEPLFIDWVRCLGGGHLVAQVERYPHADIVVGDREIMAVYAAQGRIRPLGKDSGECLSLLESYPDWLQPFALRQGEWILGLPVRWGTTPLLVKKDLVRVHRGKFRSVLNEAKSFLFWSPNEYFLYSMALIATATNPVTPLSLAPSEFAILARDLEAISERDVLVTQDNRAFLDAIIKPESEIIACAGEWVLKYLERGHPDSYRRLTRDYEYLLPPKGRLPLFFETIGILNTAPNPSVARRVAKIFTSVTIRRKLSTITHMDEASFESNPTWGDPKVLGPNFVKIPAAGLLAVGTPRRLPTDHMLRPAVGAWRDSWFSFLRTLSPGSIEGRRQSND